MVHRPSQEATEAAVVHLLKEAMLLIRFELAPLRDDVPDRQRMHRAWILADLCENLPPWLDPVRRSSIHEGVEYVWRTATAPRRAWIRSCWDRIGYDYGWLPDSPGGGPETDRGWEDRLMFDGDPWVNPAGAENVIRPAQAACWYSWRRPPRRSCRRMLKS